VHHRTNSPDPRLHIFHLVNDRRNLHRRAPSGRYCRTIDMSIVQAGRTTVARGNSRHPLPRDVPFLLFCHACGARAGSQSMSLFSFHWTNCHALSMDTLGRAQLYIYMGTFTLDDSHSFALCRVHVSHGQHFHIPVRGRQHKPLNNPPR